MISHCPFCGVMDRPLKDGITSCQNCGRVFDDSPYHRLLSASWACRKNYARDIGFIQQQYELTEEYAGIIQKYLLDTCYTHDEFLKVVKPLKSL